MIISSDFMGIKFKFKRFYVSKLQNLKFLLQSFEDVFKFYYKNISFYKYVAFIEQYKILLYYISSWFFFINFLHMSHIILQETQFVRTYKCIQNLFLVTISIYYILSHTLTRDS